jgi:single-strand DNA-binding protein
MRAAVFSCAICAAAAYVPHTVQPLQPVAARNHRKRVFAARPQACRAAVVLASSVDYDDLATAGESPRRAMEPLPPFSESVPLLNSVILVGRVGNKPEAKYLDDGKCVVNISLAVKREYLPLERKALGIRYGEEETDWFTLELWSREAEYAVKAVQKGMRVGVQGSLAIDTWEDRDGEERSAAKVS